VVVVDDQALVAALVAGDPRGLEGAYRAYADRLYTYCRGLLRDPDQAADAVHDTFVLAGQRAGQLRDPERLRPWLYAIARNECLRVLRGQARQAPLPEPDQMTAEAPEPTDILRASELQALVWAASAGLNPGDRDVFELTVRHDLAAAEVGQVLGLSVDHAHARVSRVRAQLERALGALLVARTGRRDCPELAAMLSGWDGRLTALIRKRVSRHVESCDTCQERKRRLLTPAALFSAYASAPFLLVPRELWPRLERTSFEPAFEGMRQAIAGRAGEFQSDTGFPKPLDASRFRVLVATAAALAVLGLIAAGAGALIAPDEPVAAPAAALPPSGAPLAPLASPASSAPSAPSPGPSETPSSSPAPAFVPGVPGQAGPPAAPPVVQPPPPPPPPRTSPATTSTTRPPPPPPDPFEVTAIPLLEGCGNDFYTLTVTATANEPLEPQRALLLVTVAGKPLPDVPMTVEGSTATGVTRIPVPDLPLVVWSVVATSMDGDIDETAPAGLDDPCRE
jgi:RNA polymerase sigma factor (sigma-70 family)